MATDDNTDDVQIDIVQLGPETPLIIIFHRDENGELSANVRGSMPQHVLVEQLLFMAQTIAERSQEALHFRSSPGRTACGETNTNRGIISTEKRDRVTCPMCVVSLGA